MFALYLCGCTDCFFDAMFRSRESAEKYAATFKHNPEGFHIVEWKTLADVDTSDTGWEQT